MKFDKNFLLLGVSALLLIAFLLCIVPLPARINLTLQGCSIAADAVPQENVTVALQGKLRNYLLVTDEMKADITITYESGAVITAESAGPFLQIDDDVCVCKLYYHDGDSNRYDGGYMAYSTDLDCLILEGITDGRYYIASADPNADPQALTEFFSVLTERD